MDFKIFPSTLSGYSFSANPYLVGLFFGISGIQTEYRFSKIGTEALNVWFEANVGQQEVLPDEGIFALQESFRSLLAGLIGSGDAWAYKNEESINIAKWWDL